MLERLSEDRLTGLGDSAREANLYAGATVQVSASDLSALVAEVNDHRADAREDAATTTSLHDGLVAWASTEAAARAAWMAWRRAMESQHRDISRHQAKFEILDQQDQLLHGRVAQLFITAAIEAVHDGEEVVRGHRHDAGAV
jgi:hypothetical protein